ncbi:ABC transporter permease [Acidianus manzaensis]|uniref:ABC transporter permease n=1 Tax=Acidianus manzaensis TaxID=282676 RepID=A0A1W6JWI4_9CREN|nr:ABC transporter permease [Acidianus manzaensis]ARM74609.1 hypothetical protein B6F84_00245 [Acidianus manzaensis]
MKFLVLVELYIRQTRYFLATSIFFLIFFPIAFILNFPSYDTLVGTITLFISLDIFTSISQQISSMKTVGHLTILYTFGSPKWLTGLSVSFTNMIIAIPLIVVLIFIAKEFISINVNWIGLFISVILSMIASAIIGLDLGLAFKQRQVNELSQVLGIGLSFFAPTFISYYALPLYFRIPSLLEPTTYIAQALRYDLNGSFSITWNLGIIALIAIFGALYLRLNGRSS